MDPWEVRAVVTGRPGAAMRRVVTSERPKVVAHTGRRPRWLAKSVKALRLGQPRKPAAIEESAELRRFIGTPHESAVAQAFSLAETALYQDPV